MEQPAERSYRMSVAQLGALLDQLWELGYTVVGPRVDQGAIVLDELRSLDQLPRGFEDDQSPARYRLKPAGHQRYFEYLVGIHSWKKFLFPSRLKVATAERRAEGWAFASASEDHPRYAMIGVRSCDLAAIEVQDRVFLGGDYVDRAYQRRREDALIVAVNCTTAASSCFCTSMNSGPRCRSGFDLALTEIDEGFLVETGSDAGQRLVDSLKLTAATADEIKLGDRYRQRAIDRISRKLDTDNLRDLLLGNLNHPHWDDVAARCLSCTNCTMVCPTCFCSTVSEVTDLEGGRVDRVRQWDSCFNLDFSYTVGGTVHQDTRSRYRQWLTHKLASWHDQFDTSGCVGCGRCITWCPVGIELDVEVAALRQHDRDRRSLPVIASTEGAVCEVPDD